MASAGYGHDQVQATIAHVKTLTVDKLKTVLRGEQLAVSGVKSELQIRIIAHIERLRGTGDQEGLHRVRNAVRGVPSPFAGPYGSLYPSHTPNSSASPQFPSSNGRHSQPFGLNGSPFPQNRLTFKNSPFYAILDSLGGPVECKAREATRDTARITVDLKPYQVEQLASDSNYRVMVFCAAESFSPPAPGGVDIAFPHNVELKCNSDEVKANLRGLKNKPGSTRPADITPLIRKKVGYKNNVEMIYALTTKKFYLAVNMVQKKSIDAMVLEIRRGRFITRDQVLREMRSKADDPDIVATSTVMSLKDPIVYTRIQTPCRSIACNHNQCFDAATYLQLQEQAPTWTCPICSKSAPWENLVVDQYVNDILSAASNKVEAVVIEPNGEWHVQKDDEEKNHKGNPTPSDDDDDDEDDLVEVLPRVPKLSASFEHPTFRTPPLSSREDSRAPSTSATTASASGHRSNKRPREEVIDLTLSDDDEQPAPKQIRATIIQSTSSDPSRSRPPDNRYYFQLPPPPPGPSTYHTDRFSNGYR